MLGGERFFVDAVRGELMRTILTSVILTAVLSGAMSAAELTATEQLEIQYLKDQIATSHCKFERNGRFYTVEEALAHIEKKQYHFREKINSVEKFIAFAASKSMVSNNPYYIHCPGEEKVPSAQWLREKLRVRK